MRLVVPWVTFHAVVRYAERIMLADLIRERRRLKLTFKRTGELDFQLAGILAGRGYDLQEIGEYIFASTEPARLYKADYIIANGVRYCLERNVVITLMPKKKRSKRAVRRAAWPQDLFG
jgi:hypothetical protein